jgi:SpoVK/Ycf46/Vps4 family AAA+-type ATPase
METPTEINFNVLKKITQIAKKLENSQLEENKLAEINQPLNDLALYLNVTPSQSMVFAILFILQVKLYNIDLRDIVNFLDINFIDSLNFKADIDGLLAAGLIEIEMHGRNKSKNNNFGKCNITIKTEVSESIYTNEKLPEFKNCKLDIYDFVRTVSNYIEERNEQKFDTNELFDLIKDLELVNNHLEPLKKAMSMLDIADRTLLYEIVDDHTYGYPSNIEKTLRDIYHVNKTRLLKSRELVEKSNKMFFLELISLSDSKFANDANLNLTDKSIEMFFMEDAELFLTKKKTKNTILNKDIVEKELFYDVQLADDVSFLTDSLQNENFKNLQTRMSELSLNKGVACIFYGSPGTGKTESAFQIAKYTGRDIMSVDISQTKSMWFGESEKRIKEIFDSYRKVAKTVDKFPILLFNEADAILNQRHNNSNSNVGQTENAIQNILLEELEKFEGIMIATTNLQGNLDAAYERRFLFKIKFETPTAEVKSKIWQNKLSWIDSEFAQKLSKEFSFSGGEIDNIVRKVTMKELLSGNRPDSNEIYGYCQTEKVLSKNKSGFKVGYE